MPISLIPDLLCRSVCDLDAGLLAARGITLVLADLDNTLAPYGALLPGDALKAWHAALREAGLTLFILSNSRKRNRAAEFAAALGSPFIAHAGKPRPGAFFRAMEQAGAAPGETAMVGDQIFTDIAGAKNAGVLAVAVRPIAFGTPFRALRYAAELPFRACAREKLP